MLATDGRCRYNFHAMPPIYEHRHTVRQDEIDEQGRAGNLEFLKWMQEAAVAHSSAQGWPPERYRCTGAGWVVRRHTIEYLRPAHENDRVVVRTWVANFRKIRSLREYRILRPADDSVLAVAATDWTFVGLQYGTPRRVPQELIDSFAVVSAATAGTDS